MMFSKLYPALASKISLDELERLTPSPPQTKTIRLISFGKSRSRDTKGFSEIKNFDGEHFEPTPKRLRARNHREHQQLLAMNVPHIQELPTEQLPKQGKGTGFHEPLSGNTNTTRPHPEADTSANATIEGTDHVKMNSHNRSRSFLGRNNSRSKAVHGRLDPAESGMYDNIQYADGSTEQANPKELDDRRDSGVHTGASQEILRKEKDNDSNSQGSGSSSHKKRSFLKKMHLKK